MATVIRPEDLLPFDDSIKSIFLAGSIEMGEAENWQDKVAEYFKDNELLIYNPRRANWDSSWQQTVDNEVFKKQVEWEILHLSAVSKVFFYFDPNTKSPISLLEFGIVYQEILWSIVSKFKENGKDLVTICCPKGYWRRGNLEVMCEHLGVTLFEDFNDALEDLKFSLDIK